MPCSDSLFIIGPNSLVFLTALAWLATTLSLKKHRVPTLFRVELAAVTFLLPQLRNWLSSPAASCRTKPLRTAGTLTPACASRNSGCLPVATSGRVHPLCGRHLERGAPLLGDPPLRAVHRLIIHASVVTLVQTLHHHRDPLPTANTRRRQSIFLFPPAQFV